MLDRPFDPIRHLAYYLSPQKTSPGQIADLGVEPSASGVWTRRAAVTLTHIGEGRIRTSDLTRGAEYQVFETQLVGSCVRSGQLSYFPHQYVIVSAYAVSPSSYRRFRRPSRHLQHVGGPGPLALAPPTTPLFRASLPVPSETWTRSLLDLDQVDQLLDLESIWLKA